MHANIDRDNVLSLPNLHATDGHDVSVVERSEGVDAEVGGRLGDVHVQRKDRRRSDLHGVWPR